KDLPFFDYVRIGHQHVPFGLEAWSSSRFLPLMERSTLFDAFYNEFATGIQTNNTFFCERVTVQNFFHRIDNFNQFNAATFGDGRYAYSGRISGLPIYAEDGRCLIHLGSAYQCRNPSIPADFNGGTAFSPPLTKVPGVAISDNSDILRFRTRQGLRDAIGAQGNGNRVIDTGNIICDNNQAINGEFMAYW